MEVSKAMVEKYGEALVQGRADDEPSSSRQQQSPAPFSINVTESEGLPPTEIYLLGGDDVENGSMMEAETPANGNLSMKEEATKLKHPRAPKNKRQSKKFTFDELKSQNSLLESRDEGNIETDDTKSVEEKPENCNNRDDMIQLFGNIMGEQERPNTGKTPEEMEHEEGAYWFTECGVPQIDGQNSFPTVPFDEDPEPGEINLFCNRPPPTLSPHAVKEDNITMNNPPEATQPKENMVEKDQESSSTPAPVSVPVPPKVDLPPLSPKSAAVMSMADVASFHDDIEMAPSDEMENRRTSDSEDTEQEATEEKTDGGQDPKEDEGVAVIPREIPSDEQVTQEAKEMEMETQEVTAAAAAPQPEEFFAKVEIPSVVRESGDDDSEEVLLVQSPMLASTTTTTPATAMGDLRHQLDQLRVSEALEAVSQSFKDQPFMQTEFCGQQIMEWFNTVGDVGKRNE